jgi:hypothetical protein
LNLQIQSGKNEKVTGMDEFNRSVSCGKVFDSHEKGEIPSAKKLAIKMNEAVGLEDNERMILWVVKSLCFKYVRCNGS